MQPHLYAPNAKILLVENVRKIIQKQFLLNVKVAVDKNETELF